jgi:hypothetical protein
MRAALPRWKLPWRRGGRRRATEPQRHGDGRREKGSDRKIISNPVHFLLNFTKRAFFVIFLLTYRHAVHALSNLHHKLGNERSINYLIDSVIDGTNGGN